MIFHILHSDNNLNEGLFTCLLSLGKFSYEQVAKCVIQWQPTADLRPTTKEKLFAFVKMCGDIRWWVRFVKDNFPPNKDDKVNDDA